MGSVPFRGVCPRAEFFSTGTGGVRKRKLRGALSLDGEKGSFKDLV